MSRVLGIDLGSRRIGVAVSDETATLASPHATIARSGDGEAHLAEIARLVHVLACQRVVVGLPLSMDGTDGPAARAARADAAALERLLTVPVELVDERLTTVSADRALAESGVRARKRRAVIDQTAAAVILQTWLDGHRQENQAQ